MNLPSLTAGPLTMRLDLAHAMLRDIRCHGREVLRSIYIAARDPHWTTADCPASIVKQDIQADSFTIELSGRWRHGPLAAAWCVQISGTAEGRISYEFSAVAEGDFASNRLGICVLHPLSDQPFSYNNGQSGQFPGKSIAPWPLASDVNSVQYATAVGDAVDIAFHGETFEIEDQRNWGDHSLKTYVRPQHLPKPFNLRTGEQLHHGLQLTVTPSTQEHVPAAAVVSVNKLPLGLLAVADADLLTSPVLEKLRLLQLHHLRVDVRMSQPGWQWQLETVAQAAQQLGIRLYVAAFFTDAYEAELFQLAASLEQHPADLCLVFHELQPLTPLEIAVAARRCFGPAMGLAAGTDAHFCDLNRTPPLPSADWLPCFPHHPQAHLKDETTIVENAPTLADQLHTLALYTPRPAVVSPVTYAARFPADLWFGGALAEWRVHPPDLRQNGPQAALWLQRLLSKTSGATNLFSLTLGPTHGPGGILDSPLAEVILAANA